MFRFASELQPEEDAVEACEEAVDGINISGDGPAVQQVSHLCPSATSFDVIHCDSNIVSSLLPFDDV